jgi:hypothetical protein
MRNVAALIALTLVATSVSVTSAGAQGYVIQTPGRSPTFVNPTGNGGYIMQTPGQSPTFANPTGNGGYIIQSPGQAPSFVNPSPSTRPNTLCVNSFGRPVCSN